MSVSEQGTGVSGTQRAALSRELSDFLIEFSIALHKHSMYPGGHPSLAPAASRVIERLVPLLQEKGTLSLGVARSQLVIEGVATDTKNPVLRELAARLHRHHLGAVSFRRGVGVAEIRSVLELLAIEADRTGEPLGLGPAGILSQWEHVRLYPVTYERLQLTEEQGAAEEEDEQSRAVRTRSAQLWIGLARAALAVEDADEEPSSTEPQVVARAIGEHPRGTAYDQVIVGYLLQMADELRSGGGETLELKKRVSTLVHTLDEGTLERLLDMGGDRGQRRKFLLSASEGMAVDAVLDLVRAAANPEDGQTISNSMLRMLQKLARHAEAGGGVRRMEAETAVRDQLSELIKGWSLTDPNPDAYGEALQRMAGAESLFAVSPDARYRPEPRRLLEMSLEVDETGTAIERAVERVLAEAGVREVLDMLERTDAPAVRRAVWDRLAEPEMIESIARAEPLDADLLDRVISEVGETAIEPLLNVLEESESSQTRRVLLDRLARMGPAVGPLAAARLVDRPWFVQRNMIALMGELPERPPDFELADYLEHEDARVRREAIRILVSDPMRRERAICVALADKEERNVRLGLTAALDGCPKAAVPLVMSRTRAHTPDDVRALAVRVVAQSGGPQALDLLLSIAAPRKQLMRIKLPAKSQAYLAALRGLHGFVQDARAREALALAVRSRDPEIAKAAVGAQEAKR
ncbi:MAG: hypothetical protein ACE5PT_01945 [Gemmatimonadales bacterium]